MCFYFFPMYQNEELLGIFAVDLKLDYLQGLVEEFSDLDHGECSFVIDGEGVVVAHPDSVQIEEQYNYSTLTKTVSRKDEAGNPMTDKDGNIITEEQEFTLSKDVQQVMTQVMSGNSGKHDVDGGDCGGLCYCNGCGYHYNTCQKAYKSGGIHYRFNWKCLRGGL